MKNTKSSLLNLNPEIKKYGGLEIPVYRIIPFKYLLDILINKELTFTQTKTWEDTYENYLLKSRYNIGLLKGRRLEGYQNNYYGICFTLKRESDALWRIYSNDKLSVRIKTKLSSIWNLRNYINDSDEAIIDVNVDKVKYLTLKRIKEHYAQIEVREIVDNFTSYVMDSMFIKRDEFHHEKELRIIINKTTITQDNLAPKTIIKYPIDPNKFIEQIVFDPRLDFKIYTNMKKTLKIIGYKNLILRSKLYSYKDIEFKQ